MFWVGIFIGIILGVSTWLIALFLFYLSRELIRGRKRKREEAMPQGSWHVNRTVAPKPREVAERIVTIPPNLLCRPTNARGWIPLHIYRNDYDKGGNN